MRKVIKTNRISVHTANKARRLGFLVIISNPEYDEDRLVRHKSAPPLKPQQPPPKYKDKEDLKRAILSCCSPCTIPHVKNEE